MDAGAVRARGGLRRRELGGGEPQECGDRNGTDCVGRPGVLVLEQQAAHYIAPLSLLKMSYCTFHSPFTFFHATTYLPLSSRRRDSPTLPLPPLSLVWP